MKKYLIVAALLVATAGLARSATPMVPVPEANNAQGAQIDYGGTYVSTGAFTVNHVTVTISGSSQPVTSGVFQNIVFSSGNSGNYDFVDVWDSSSADITINQPPWRFYNISGTTGTVTGGNLNQSASGNAGPRYPIRFFKGLIWRASTAVYNSIVVQYWR